MEMLGVHARGRNAHVPPERSRPGHDVANAAGDLDAYVVHFDEPNRFGGLRPLWNELSGRMKAMLPRACAMMSEELERAGVRRRLLSAMAHHVVSDDLLVNNVGVSAAYQSPPHFDVSDVGWTFAFSCKCGTFGRTVRMRTCANCDVGGRGASAGA